MTTTTTRTPHRVTVRKTPQQVARLQEIWVTTTTPTKEQREQIADEIGLDTRIVSTWFRDERSKLTRQRAEQQRNSHNASTSAIGGTLGPVRNTRNALVAVANSTTNAIDAVIRMDEDDEEAAQSAPLDRHQSPPSTSTVQSVRVSPRPSTARFSPYPIAAVVPNTPPMMTRRHFDHGHDRSVGGHGHAQFNRPSPSAPIDIHRHHQPGAAAGGHRSNLSTETVEMAYMRSPVYPSLSVSAPSVADDSSETSSDEDEDEDDDYREYGYDDDDEDEEMLGVPSPSRSRRDRSPLTPLNPPSSLPSPRVMQAPSTSVPPNTTGLVGLPPISTIGVGIAPNGSFSPPVLKHLNHHHLYSPVRQPITLPTTTGGTYTFEPLPVVLGPQPNRDSKWRWGYYDKVSSMRHTLRDKLQHQQHREETTVNSDEEDGPAGFSDGLPSPLPSPTFRSARLDTGSNAAPGVFDRLGGLFVGGGGGSRKQFFAPSRME